MEKTSEENMFELQKLPEWMKQFIPVLTDGGYKTEEELVEKFTNVKSWEMAVIVTLNSRINMLKDLQEQGLLKVSIKKPIMEVQLGEIFKIYPNQERYFTKKTTNELEGFISVYEYMGGTGFSSSWLGERSPCHSDIEVEVVPSLPEKFYK